MAETEFTYVPGSDDRSPEWRLCGCRDSINFLVQDCRARGGGFRSGLRSDGVLIIRESHESLDRALASALWAYWEHILGEKFEEIRREFRS